MSPLQLVGPFTLADQSLELGHATSHHVVVHEGHCLSIHIVLELKREVGEEGWQGQLRQHLNEGLANADACAAQEG